MFCLLLVVVRLSVPEQMTVKIHLSYMTYNVLNGTICAESAVKHQANRQTNIMCWYRY